MADGRKYILGFIDIDPAKRDRFMALADTYARACREEPDCNFFQLLRDRQRADRVVLLECFSSEEAHARHHETQHFKTLVPQMFALCRSGHFENVIARSVESSDAEFSNLG